MTLAALVSMQLMLLRSSFSQQSKDASVINKEVLHEYDTKFVHPRTQPQMRDVGTQYSSPGTFSDGNFVSEDDSNSVDTYIPTIILNRGFHTRPNPNYVKHVDPQGFTERPKPSQELSSSMTPICRTPAHLRDASSPLQSRTAIRQPQFRTRIGPRDSDGGNLGVYFHANSPLKKSASTDFTDAPRQHDRGASPVKRVRSPLKRSSVPGGTNGIAANQRWAHLQEASARRDSGRF
ncbi:hypothetical protein MMC24_001633 [Lignoscripta atroalba]|nr:hypothetical protein [Lignoscripta atroalba]